MKNFVIAPTLSSSCDAAEASVDEQIEFEAIDLFARSPEGLIAGIVPLGITVVLLPQLAQPRWLWPWAAAVAGVLLYGLFLTHLYRHSSPQPGAIAHWRRRFVVLTAVSGLAWGSAGWLFIPAPWQGEMFVLGLLMALSASLVANIGANLSIYVAYVIGTWLPTIAYRTWLGGALNIGLSVSALASIVVLTLFAARMSTGARRSMRMGHENKRIAEALAERTLEAEQASVDKSRFIAAASHDLRQPVHALGLLLDVLQGQSLAAAARGTTERMARVLQSLDSLFNGLLDISKLDSGGIEPRSRSFLVEPMLARVVEEFGVEAAAKGLRLRLRQRLPRDSAGLGVISDPQLFERMLRNLIANAVRYTASGGILISARRRAQFVCVEVWDSGVGIPGDQQKAVWDEFYQVANAEKNREKGLGLGLAIVARLGRLLDHPVSLRSRLGRGSVFRIDLPCAPSVGVDTKPDADVVEVPFAGSQKQRFVLVVDDDTLVRDALERWLGSWGCRVTSCADAAAVSAALGMMPTAPDALITDWRLPGPSDGLEVTRMVRERFSPSLPTILITGDEFNDLKELATKHLVVLLQKPVRPAALRAALSAQWSPLVAPASVVE